MKRLMMFLGAVVVVSLTFVSCAQATEAEAEVVANDTDSTKTEEMVAGTEADSTKKEDSNVEKKSEATDDKQESSSKGKEK